MDSLSGAEAIVRMLDLYGVRHVFGLCGDTSLPLYDALCRMEHGITHVLTRDERSAAYMADGYARVSGRPGVCEGPSGGGATYLLPGLVEANESCSPVLGITSDVPVTSRGRYPLTELDQESLFRPLTKWNTVCDRADQVPQAVRSAFRLMTTGRPGAAHIGLPYDVLKAPVDPAEIWCQAEHGRYPAWRSGPDPAAVAGSGGRTDPGQPCRSSSAAAACWRPARPASSRRWPSCSTRRSAPPSPARAASPTPHPLGVGVVGLNGGVVATREVVQQADLVVFVGCRAGSTTTERWTQPPRDVPIVHIDVDPAVVSANYRTAHALIGDARLTLTALRDRLTAGPARPGAAGRRRGRRSSAGPARPRPTPSGRWPAATSGRFAPNASSPS